MKQCLMIFALLVLVFPALSYSQCLTNKELSIYMETQQPLPNSNLVLTLECDPCKCPASMADCYAFMAEKEREKEENNRKMRDIYERYIKHGVCK